jgi:hypothetical protein
MTSREQAVVDLVKILATMDIPELRRSREALADMQNIRWLGRNIMFRNSQHPQCEAACGLIRQLLAADPCS